MRIRPESLLGMRPLELVAGAVIIAVSGTVHAQVLRIEPSIHFRVIHTDNARVERDSRQSDLVAHIEPGLAVASARPGARITGRANARLGLVIRDRDRDRSTATLGLQGHATVAAVEDRLFVDLDAAVRRSNQSLFTGRADDDFLVTDRRNETRTYSIAPRLEFRLGTMADGRARYESRWLDSGGSAINAQRLDRWDLTLANPTALGRAGWGVRYARLDTTYDDREIDDVTEQSVRATVFYRVAPQFRLRGGIGYERNDFGGPRVDKGSIVGAGFDWVPTPRTAISGSVEDRFFGTGYDLTLTHRRARSNWLLSYGRDVSSSIRTLGSVFQDAAFVTFFDDPFYVAQFPDPLERESAIRDLLGLSGPNFVSAAHFVDRRLRAAVSLVGTRNTLTLSAQRSDRSRVSPVVGLRADDEFRDADRVRTAALAASLIHRLSGTSALTASVTHSRAEREGVSSQEIRRWIAALGYTIRLSPKAVAGLNYRFQKAQGATDFRENVVSASLGLRF